MEGAHDYPIRYNNQQRQRRRIYARRSEWRFYFLSQFYCVVRKRPNVISSRHTRFYMRDGFYPTHKTKSVFYGLWSRQGTVDVRGREEGAVANYKGLYAGFHCPRKPIRNLWYPNVINLIKPVAGNRPGEFNSTTSDNNFVILSRFYTWVFRSSSSQRHFLVKLLYVRNLSVFVYNDGTAFVLYRHNNITARFIVPVFRDSPYETRIISVTQSIRWPGSNSRK